MANMPAALLSPSPIVSRLSIVIPLIFSLSLFLCLEDFPEENTDCQYDANFLDHSSVNMNEILCLDVGGDKYRDGWWRVARMDAMGNFD